MLQIAKVNENATAPQSIGQSTESRAKPGDFDLAIAAVCALQSQVSVTPVSTLQGQGNSGGEAGSGSGGMIDVNTVIDEAMAQNLQVPLKTSAAFEGITQQVGYPVYASPSPTPVAIVQGQANLSSESASGAGQLNLSPVYSDAVLGQNLQETVEPLTSYQPKAGGALPDVQGSQGITNPVPAALLEQNPQEPVEHLTSFQPKSGGGVLPEVQAGQVNVKAEPASILQHAVQVAPEKVPMPEQPAAGSKVKTTSAKTSFQTQAVAANPEISEPVLATQQVSQRTDVKSPVLEQLITSDQRDAKLNAQETGFSRFDSTTALPENKNVSQEAKLTPVFSSDKALSPEEIQNKPVFEKSEAVKTVKDSGLIGGGETKTTGSDTMQSLTTQFSLKQLSETQNSSSFTKRVDLPEFKEGLLREIRQIITTHRGESQTQVQLRLEPEHLGHLTVKLFLNKGELNAHFYAESSYVKNILEGSIQQLKDALGQQDLRLNEALVFTGNDGQDGTSRYFEGKNRHAMSNHIEFNQDAYGEIQVETADLTAAEAVSTRVNYLI